MFSRVFKKLLAKTLRAKLNKDSDAYTLNKNQLECTDSKPIAAADLCDDILILIFKASIGSSIVNRKKWKQNLPLLAVCRRWRASAASLVYNHVFLSLNVQCGSKRTSFISIGGQKLPKYKHLSNSSLFISGMLSHMARSLHIHINNPISTLSMYRGVVDLLNFQMASWHNIKSMTLEFGPGVLEGITNSYADPQTFIRKFTTNIQKLENLDIAVLDVGNGRQCDFVNRFTDAYAAQLKHISIDTDITLHGGRFSDCLTKLELSMKPLAIQTLPYINPGALQQLSLFDVATNFEWNIFAKNSSNILEFSCLQKLSIGYMVDKNSTSTGNLKTQSLPRLCFPALRRLHIFRCPPNCILLSKKIYPAKLDKFVVECPPGVATLAKLKTIVPSKELVVLLSEIESGEKIRYHNATNEIFKSNRVSDSLSLILLNRQSVPDPDIIQWNSLSCLFIRAFVPTLTLLKLLVKLPNLSQLAATYLISNHYASNAQVLQKQVVHPNIKELHLDFALGAKVTHRDTEFVLYLLAGIPTLASIKTSPLLSSRLEKSASYHLNTHPHIQNVKLIHGK